MRRPVDPGTLRHPGPRHPETPWTLAPQVIDSFRPAHRLTELPLRMAVGDVQRGGGRGGATVSGKIEAGAVRAGGAVLLMPSGQLATVK